MQATTARLPALLNQPLATTPAATHHRCRRPCLPPFRRGRRCRQLQKLPFFVLQQRRMGLMRLCCALEAQGEGNGQGKGCGEGAGVRRQGAPEANLGLVSRGKRLLESMRFCRG